jgi:hypothetical protein
MAAVGQYAADFLAQVVFVGYEPAGLCADRRFDAQRKQECLCS